MTSLLRKRSPAPRLSAGNRAIFNGTSVSGVTRVRRETDFGFVNRAAVLALPAILRRLLPCGRIQGREFVALNPRRADRRLGSFKVNLRSGRWCDFATGDKGGDPVSLVAFLANVSQREGARLLARMLGIDVGGPQ